MDVQTSKKEYAALREKALAICDRAVAADRQLTEAEHRELTATVEHAKGLQARIEQQRGTGMSMEELDRIIQAGLEGGSGPPQPGWPPGGPPT